MAKFAVGAIKRTANGDTYTQSDVFCHEYYSAWSHLTYDATTGEFFSRRLKRKVGSVCKHNGYVKLWVGSKKYNAHRIAWVMTHGRMPLECIDHINRIRNDNRIMNLREATFSQNCMNAEERRINKHGLPGVHFNARKKRWFAQITVNSRYIHLGMHSTAQEARKARIEAEIKYFGEFRNTK